MNEQQSSATKGAYSFYFRWKNVVELKGKPQI